MTTGTALAASAALYFVNPETHTLSVCPLREFAGLWCPLCGATRATYSLMHGDLTAALHDNGLYILAIPLLAAMWVRWLMIGGRDPAATFWRDHPERRRRLWFGVLVVTLAFTVLRNLPQFAWLAPPA